MKEKMKSLFEKIKSLDKKVLIGAGAGLAVLIIAIVVILVVCFGGKDTEVDKDNEKDKTTYVVGENTIKSLVSTLPAETIVVVDGDIALEKVNFGVTVKSTNDSNVTANGLTVTEAGITIEANSNVEITPIEKE